MSKLILAILFSVVITAGICLYLARSYFLKKQKNEGREVRRALERMAMRQSESQMVLASLSMGVLAYSGDGVLLLSNDAASQMLSEIPHSFQQFLDVYDKDQTMQANLLLGKKTTELTLLDGDHHYHLSVNEKKLGRQTKPAHIVVVQDISQQVKAEQQRKEFVANVSHELKTPLTMIKSYSESLLDWGIDEKSKEAIKKDLDRLYQGSIRMENLINDLLLLSRIDGRALYTKVEKRELMPVVRICLERLYTEADAKKIDISSYAVSDKVLAYIDVSAFERIIMNIVGNAIKYTGEFGEVKVYVGALIDEVYVKVVDNGIGIPVEAQENIFKRFYRVDVTGSRQHGGTGLGLSIVKELVDLHQGQLDLKSEPGQGSEFTVFLPGIKKLMRRALYELVENDSCSNVMTKAAEQDLEKLAKELGIMAQWKSLQQADLKRILQVIENRY